MSKRIPVAVLLVFCVLFIFACMCQDDKNYLDCPGNQPTWGLFRVCCKSIQLPKGCECFDIRSSDFTNSAYHKPLCPEYLKVNFNFYDHQHSKDFQRIHAGKGPILSTAFNGQRDTIIVIHGFTDRVSSPWQTAMRNELLKGGDFNVIVVDWENAAKGPDYFQAVANARTVGAMLARLILDLHIYTGAGFEKFHLVGHSLGAHVAGYAGKEIHRLTFKKVGRITGLDPAGPAFEGYKSTVRLNATDAMFVEAIHTDAEPLLSSGFGIRIPVADADYYPNGGKHQPGCPPETGGLLSMLDFEDEMSVGACSHSFSLYLFIDSINKCPYHMCTMGFHTDPSCWGNFYPKTTASEPFC